MIYVDSCVLIYLVQGDSSFADQVEKAFSTQPLARFAISALVEMECLVGAFKQKDFSLEMDFRRIFQAHNSLPITGSTFIDAARLRADHHLKTPDALHLAVALQHGCEALWTNDDRLSKAVPGYTVNVLRSHAH